MSSTSDIGAAAELLVCADLLRRGFQVFRNVSPNGAIDLIAERNSDIWRVQVKSRQSSQWHGGEWDLFAGVWGNEIRYDDWTNRLVEMPNAVKERKLVCVQCRRRKIHVGDREICKVCLCENEKGAA